MQESQQYELYQDIVSSISDPVVVLNENFEYIFHNRAARELTGLKEEILHKNIWEVFPVLQGTWFKAACEEAMEKRVSLQFEEYYPVFKEWAEISIYPFKTGITILFNAITTRKVKELEDFKLIKRNSLILQSMGDMYLLVDGDMRITDVNRSTCEVLQYTREELRNRHLWDIDCKYTKEDLPAIITSSTKPATPFLDTCFLSKDGEKHVIELVIFSLKIDGKDQYGLVGRDISELQKANKKLQKSNERFELLGSIAQDALWEIDAETGEMWANEIHQGYYGLSLQDPVPGEEEWYSRIHPEDVEEVQSSIKIARDSKLKKWEQEYRFRSETRGWINVYDRTYLIRDGQGRLTRMLGSMLDITHLKQTRQNLMNEKKLSDSIINSLPGTFYLFDEKLNILRWNENLSLISKFTHSEIAQMTALDFFDEEQAPAAAKSVELIFEQGYVETETFINTKTRDKVPFYLIGKLVEIEGKKYLLGTGTDLTKLKETEKKLQRLEQETTHDKVQAQKSISRAIIKAQEKERNHLAAELHDNINQLLAGARLYLNMACKQHPETKETISYPMELLDQTIQEIRKLSHKYVTPQKYVNLEKLILTLIERIEKSTETKVALSYKVSEDCMDDDLKINIYRIVQEQVNNILRHAHSDIVRITLITTPAEVQLTVRDEGIGFNPLEKKDGVGLNNIINRAEAYNGTVHIESAHQKGTTLEVKIPVSNKKTT